MYDAEDPGKVINEFLVSLFVPGIATLVALFAVFRRYLDDLLLSWGLARIVPRSDAGAISAGYGRFGLLLLLTVAVLLVYLEIYRRFLRESLRERGYV